METLDITPITEEAEEEEKEDSKVRGASILEGYFDTSHSTIEEEKENDTPCNISDISPASAQKRRSESPAKEHSSPTKRLAAASNFSATPSSKSKKSPAVMDSKRNSRSPLSCLKGSTTTSFKRGEVSPADPDFNGEDSPITVRSKPKFKVVNGKLMPI
jgi:hypothetical protein